MPWESKSIAEARREFVTLAQAKDANIRSLCQRFSVSPRVGYKFLNRYREEGENGLADRSRKPHHVPKRTSAGIEAQVIEIRTAHPYWGGRKIAAEMKFLGRHPIPAPSTITDVLKRNGQLPYREADSAAWISALIHNKLNHEELNNCLRGIADRPVLLDRLYNGRLSDRKRAVAVIASRRNFKSGSIFKLLGLSREACRHYVRRFEEGGASALFTPRVSRRRKFDDEKLKAAVFTVLHQPPSTYGINRTTWTLAGLSRILSETGNPVCEDVIRRMIKAAGYRWRRACPPAVQR